MIVRIFYSSPTLAKRNGHPPVGTKFNISTTEDLFKLTKQLKSDIIIPYDTKEYPLFIDQLLFDIYDEDDLELGHVTEKPDESWKSDTWIEVYNYHRE